jgi:hypothetical protein
LRQNVLMIEEIGNGQCLIDEREKVAAVTGPSF